MISSEDSPLIPPDIANEQRARAPVPWLTVLFIAICTASFLVLNLLPHESSEFWLYRLAPDASDFWDGAWWGLFTSVFVHIHPMHWLFNMSWLWAFGKVFERTLGPVRFLLFWIGASFVSSAFQFAVSDGTGIGASGVGFALFGFVWFARPRYPPFRRILDRQAINYSLAWLIGCIVATQLQMVNIGNTAHISGLLFGILTALLFVLKDKRALAGPAFAILIIAAAVPLFWNPWSVSWLAKEAYVAHAKKDYPRALEFYSKMIKKLPDDGWAYENRAEIYKELKDDEKAKKDLEKGVQLKEKADEIGH